MIIRVQTYHPYDIESTRVWWPDLNNGKLNVKLDGFKLLLIPSMIRLPHNAAAFIDKNTCRWGDKEVNKIRPFLFIFSDWNLKKYSLATTLRHNNLIRKFHVLVAQFSKWNFAIFESECICFWPFEIFEIRIPF